jgi:hypothetical protein
MPEQVWVRFAHFAARAQRQHLRIASIAVISARPRDCCWRTCAGCTPGDYVQAQRVRTRTLEAFRWALFFADVIATPTTPKAAPALSRHAARGDELDIGEVVETMRFIHLASFTGLPATSVPAGYDGRGPPIGLHLAGRCKEESLLFSVASAAESAVVRQRPRVHFDLLPELGWGNRAGAWREGGESGYPERFRRSAWFAGWLWRCLF